MGVRHKSLFGLIALSVALSSCLSRIPEPADIEVPNGLGRQSVEIAILSALRFTPPPGSFDSRKAMPEEEFERLVWAHYFTGQLNRGWRVESREPGRFVASHQRGGHLLRIQVTYDDRRANVSLVDSSNFRQGGRLIHSRAVSWIEKLEARIRAELQRQGLRHSFSVDSPEAPGR